jgi:hypothetical protein
MSRAVSKSSAPNRGRIAMYAIGTLLVVALIVVIGLLNRSAVPNSASNAPITSTLKVGNTAPEFAVPTTPVSSTLPAFRRRCCSKCSPLGARTASARRPC